MNEEIGFTTALLAWYHTHRRILPWREHPDPYRVWIAEIMLQQTRIETVIPYFERFIDRLPTVADLAAVDAEVLYKLWEGLGYYRRAANVKQAAQLICDRHEGQVPAEIPTLLALPGIGTYTAGAIASIAFQHREIAVDGNVKRVIARVFGITGPIDAIPTSKTIARLVRDGQPASRPGDYTQALMELGAIVCLPSGKPRCDDCPLLDRCVARKQNAIAAIPAKTAKRPRKIERRTVFILHADGRYFICKRPHTGLLADLWEFYNIEGFLEPEPAETHLRSLFGSVGTPKALTERMHVFTHLEWHMRGYLVDLSDPQPRITGTFVTLDELASGYPLPGAFQSFLEEIHQDVLNKDQLQLKATKK